mmetsp:Transcript_20806/g.38886  ORF Transcript_20806/g.38886 Transcript_20806/m.38886 type:complete len:98 (-) Transcript_20806:175-468(-)
MSLSKTRWSYPPFTSIQPGIVRSFAPGCLMLRNGVRRCLSSVNSFHTPVLPQEVIFSFEDLIKARPSIVGFQNPTVVQHPCILSTGHVASEVIQKCC